MKWLPKTHIFESPASTSWPSSSGLLGHRRTYHTILESADHAIFKMVRYVLDPATSEAEARWPRRRGGRFKNMGLWGPFHLKRPLVAAIGLTSALNLFFVKCKESRVYTVGEMTVFAPD
jgi:hypothetical protein